MKRPNRSPRVSLFYSPTRQMDPHGKRERERRLRQIAKGSLKVTAAKVHDERPTEDMPGPGQEEARPISSDQIEADAGNDAADLGVSVAAASLVS